MATILLGIDGTGSWSDETYRSENAHSFVSRINYRTHVSPKRYIRGPSVTGYEFDDIVDRGSRWIMGRHPGEGDRVLMTGWSRGAAACVAIAHLLRGEGIRVAALMMFDCVRMVSTPHPTASVPDNVDYVYHARRAPWVGSRESFGNSGLGHPSTPPPHYTQVFYPGTHGALGGVPSEGPASHVVYELGDGLANLTYGQDEAAVEHIWSGVRPWLLRHGFIG